MIADSVRKLAGQALVAGFQGTTPPAELIEAAGRGELGGFILFRRNLGAPDQVAGLTRALAEAFPRDLPPWIAVDQEGGRVQRLGAPVLQLPPMRAIGRLDDLALTEQIARALGAQLSALGFNMDFAPVLDVDTHPDSPVIGDRSFGAEPERVTRHGRAFARGLQSAGVAACGKHFPGHGDAALDSHLALPHVAHDRARLERVELAPFAALAGELCSIMTAHIVFAAIEAGRPATLSRTALVELLRAELGFGGVIFSDDLRMKAIADQIGIPQAACEAIAAGCDVLLVCDEPQLSLEVHAALIARAEHDPAFVERLGDAAARSLSARRRFPARALGGAALAAALSSSETRALEDRLAHALSQLANSDAALGAVARVVAAIVLLCASTAYAQTTALTENDFNLDLVTGPVLGSGRIIGLGGAYTALAVGVEGAGWNPAAYASRAIWQNDWFDWNGTLNIIPSTIKNSDFDNNGEPGFTYDNFIFGSVGLGAQFGEFGVGGLLNLQTYQVGNATDLLLVTANYGVGYMFNDGQLVVGAGVRTVELSLDESASGNSLVTFGGTMPEAGMVLRPAGRPWRIGFAARMPVVSDSSNKVVAGGLTLPREIRMPWEVQAGIAWQIGGRPLNRKWINTHDLEKKMRDEMLEQRSARAREQWRREQLAERMQLVQDRTLPSVAELEPNPEVASPEGMPHEQTWWSEEYARRWDEERALLAHLAELAEEREREVRALSRRYLLFSADAIAVGPTPDGVGLESFLSQIRQRSGEHTTFGFRFGIEGEPIAHWVQMRAGTYLEPSRFAGVGYRVHGTLGADVRLFSWDFFGLLDEFTLRAGAAADVAERYLNAGIGVGLWH